MTIFATTPKGLKLIDFNTDNWHQDEYDNWTLMDALLSANLGDTPFAVAGGTAAAITLDYAPNRVLANGLTIVFRLTATSTGATTVNVDGLGAVPLILLGAALTAGDLQAGDIVRAVYDGVSFNVIEPIRRISNLKLISDLLVTLAGNGGINLSSPDASTIYINFGDTSNPGSGAINYNHATDVLEFVRGGNVMLSFDATAPIFTQGIMKILMSGANDFVIEQSANRVRFGHVGGVLEGMEIDLTTGDVIFRNDVTVGGDLTVIGTLTAVANLATIVGTLDIANGGTGATTAANARANLGLGALAILGSVNDANWAGADLTIANGGTGASTASAAAAALGVLETAGGTMTGDIVRSGKGIHPFFSNAGMTGGEIYIQAIGADPTANPGDIVFEY